MVMVVDMEITEIIITAIRGSLISQKLSSYRFRQYFYKIETIMSIKLKHRIKLGTHFKSPPEALETHWLVTKLKKCTNIFKWNY